MKKQFIFLTVLILCLTVKIHAQVKFAGASDIQAFLKSTTYVVEYGDPLSDFNESIKAVMPKLWTITPYKFITEEEFETKKTSKNSSFIFLSDAQLSEDGITSTYTFLNIVMGGSSDINKLPDLGSVPLSYSDVDEDSYLYKLGGLLLFIQDHIKYSSENSSIKPAITKKNSTIDLATKEIWLLESDLQPGYNTLDKIKLVYPNTVKLVSIDEIKKAIDSKNEAVIFLHKVGPESSGASGKCWKFLVHAKTGEVVYYDSHKISASEPDSFLGKDFKAIAK